MAPLTPEKRAELLAETRDAAVALLEDLEHIRMICGRDEPSRDELRRLSATLRRILIDSDLTKVAAPRLGRILLLAPDNKPLVKSNTKTPYHSFLVAVPTYSASGCALLLQRTALNLAS
jgi:hypothetical protein